MFSLESFVNIKSVTDEIDLWNNMQSSMSIDGDLIHGVASALEPLREWFNTLEMPTWSQAGEFIDQVMESLDRVWKAEGRGSQV
jgi:hypothetical protein